MLNLIGRPRAVAGLAIDDTGNGDFLHESQCGDFHLHLLDEGADSRLEAERYIAEAYCNIFGANLRSFYPSLIALHDREHRVLGMVGARWASNQRLFVEHYLEQSIECAIAVYTGPVCRDQVLELGNFAIGSPASVYLFLALIGDCVQQYEVQWLVFSLTAPLRRMLKRSGVPLHDLAPAKGQQAPQDGNDWGRYYDLNPRVCAVPASEGLARFLRAYRRLQVRVQPEAMQR